MSRIVRCYKIRASTSEAAIALNPNPKASGVSKGLRLQGLQIRSILGFINFGFVLFVLCFSIIISISSRPVVSTPYIKAFYRESISWRILF